jgi:hypothetical protein
MGRKAANHNQVKGFAGLNRKTDLKIEAKNLGAIAM